MCVRISVVALLQSSNIQRIIFLGRRTKPNVSGTHSTQIHQTHKGGRAPSHVNEQIRIKHNFGLHFWSLKNWSLKSKMTF